MCGWKVEFYSGVGIRDRVDLMRECRWFISRINFDPPPDPVHLILGPSIPLLNAVVVSGCTNEQQEEKCSEGSGVFFWQW